MNKMELLDLLLCFIEYFTVYVFFEKLLARRFSNKALTFAAAVINALIVYFISTFSVIKTIVCLVSVFIGCSVVYREKFYIKSAFSITLIYSFHIIDIVIGNIMSFVMDKSILEVFYSDFLCRSIICLIIKAVNIFSIMLLYKAFKRSGLDLDRRIWLLFNIVMAVFLSVTTAFMDIYPNRNISREFEIMCMVISVSFLVMSVIVIYFFTYICTSFRQNRKLYLLQSSYEAIEESLSVQSQNIQKLRKIRHDLRNHLLNAKILIEKNDTNEAQHILDEIIGQTENINIGITQTTGNSIIDAAITYKTAVCCNKNIQIEYFLENLPELSIDPVDISSLISNLMDNAIEAAEKTSDPYIKIQISMYRKYLTIYVRNSSLNDLQFDINKNELLSTKLDKTLHGYGMQIINDIALKYDGVFQWKFEDGFFIANVLLKNS